jgi:predicted DNA-binding transcriptional regulator YafY
MQIFKYIERINLIDKLITQRKTGTPDELAKRLNISVSRLARILEYMRIKGAPIVFDRSSCNYYYKYDYSIQIKIQIESLDGVELKAISAGQGFFSTFFPDAFFVH